jgi:hypothetical protein
MREGKKNAFLRSSSACTALRALGKHVGGDRVQLGFGLCEGLLRHAQLAQVVEVRGPDSGDGV